MPRLDLGEPYNNYVQSLIRSGLYSSYTEVVKDALRKHMDAEAESKRIAWLQATIAEGEADIKAGRIVAYTPDLIDQITAEALTDDA